MNRGELDDWSRIPVPDLTPGEIVTWFLEQIRRQQDDALLWESQQQVLAHIINGRGTFMRQTPRGDWITTQAPSDSAWPAHQALHITFDEAHGPFLFATTSCRALDALNFACEALT